MTELLQYLLSVKGGQAAAAEVRPVREEITGLEAATGRVNLAQDASVAHSGKAARGLEGVKKSAGALHGALLLTAGALGFGALKVGLNDIVRSGTDWQEQQAALGQALKNTHQNSRGLATHLSDHAETLSTQGGFAAPQQIQALTQMVTQTGSVTKAVKLNAAAMNLARGAHIGYAQAVRLVETADAGTPGRLSRIIGAIVPVTKYTANWTDAMKKANPVGYAHAQMLNKQATASEIVGRIQQKMGGQMSAFSHTAAGAMSNASNAIDNAGRQISVALLPYIAKLATWFAKNLPAAINWTIGAVKGVIGWFNRHKTTALVLRDTLIALGITIGGVLAVNRILNFGRSFLTAAGNVKSAVKTILTKMSLIGPAAVAEATAVEGADAGIATANAGVGASFVALLPEVAGVGIAVAGLYAAAKGAGAIINHFDKGPPTGNANAGGVVPNPPGYFSGGPAPKKGGVYAPTGGIPVYIPPASTPDPTVKAPPSNAGYGHGALATRGVLVTGDIHVHLGGKHIGRITREQLRAATVTGA